MYGTHIYKPHMGMHGNTKFSIHLHTEGLLRLPILLNYTPYYAQLYTLLCSTIHLLCSTIHPIMLNYTPYYAQLYTLLCSTIHLLCSTIHPMMLNYTSYDAQLYSMLTISVIILKKCYKFCLLYCNIRDASMSA